MKFVFNIKTILFVLIIGCLSSCVSDSDKKETNANATKNANEEINKVANKSETELSENVEVEELVEAKKIEEKESIETKEVVAKPKPPKKKKEEKKLDPSLVNNPKTASKPAKPKPSGPAPIAKFDYKEFDFGVVDEGDIVKHEFFFTNVGNAPLIISEASSSCGCTVPEYPKKPIKPGERSSLKVKFDTKSRLNKQRKSITIKANTQPNYTTVYLVGDVWRRPKKDDPNVSNNKTKEEEKAKPSDGMPFLSKEAKEKDAAAKRKAQEQEKNKKKNKAKNTTKKEGKLKKAAQNVKEKVDSTVKKINSKNTTNKNE